MERRSASCRAKSVLECVRERGVMGIEERSLEPRARWAGLRGAVEETWSEEGGGRGVSRSLRNWALFIIMRGAMVRCWKKVAR